MTYEKYLNKCVDELFSHASKEYTWRELAKQAGLSYTTVYRLGTYKTKLPQLRTVFKLCKAVGIEFPAIFRKRLRLVG